MRITRSTLRRLIAEESARLLREAAEEEESTAMDEAERGKKGHGKKGHADCLYVLYGGRGVYYYTAPCGLSEREAAKQGHDVSADVAGGEDMADPLSLYDWLQRHDEITAVYDDESAGGEVSKDEFMEQLHAVGGEEGLFADDEFINEDDDLEEGAFPEEIEGMYGEEPPVGDDEEDDYYGDDDPFGDDEAIEKGYEYVPGIGYKKPGDDSWADIETGDDDVPYGAADVAGRMGRGHRTDEGHDHDMDDYEHAYAMGGGPDEEGFAIDYDTGRPSPFAAKHLPKPRPAVDDVEGEDQSDVWGDDDMGRKGAMDDYEHAWKMGGGRDEDGFAMDYDKLDEARWGRLAGILKG